MAKGNSQETAIKVNLRDRRRVLRSAIGGDERSHFYIFTVKNRSSFSLTMDKLKRNVDVQLLDRTGAVIQTSANRGKRSESIVRNLDSGTYFIRSFANSSFANSSFANKGGSRYRLTLAASTITANGQPVPDEDCGCDIPAKPLSTPSPAPTPSPQLSSLPNVKLTQAATGLMEPTFVTHAGDGTNRLFVTEKAGKIQIIENGKPRANAFLDISDRVSTEVEQGLASVAFPSNYESTGRFYVDYSNKDGDIVISRFQVNAGDRNDAIEASEQVLLTIPHREGKNHYGGQLAFDSSGYLYISTGDGGVKNDPAGNAQNPQSLLGKILRIDIETLTTNPYVIPSSNPFTAANDPQDKVRDEIWSTGLRNPWRFSIDTATGNLYIADVGQSRYEEINFQVAGSGGGQNYGWNLLEGNASYPAGSPAVNNASLTAPVFVYDHTQGKSVTGGYVYRGGAIAGLQGTYVYGDFVNGNIWGLRQTGTGGWDNQLLLDSDKLISSFGQDEQGNLYLTDFYGNAETNGVIYRIDAA
jgi:glucose/arabinose dehydrogenase